jgi:hypothetical protein
MTPASLPWAVRYAIAAHHAGRPLPGHLLMCVQMTLNGHGCASCPGGGR